MTRTTTDLKAEAEALNALFSPKPRRLAPDLNAEAVALDALDHEEEREYYEYLAGREAERVSPFGFSPEWREWAFNCGMDNPDRQWLLTDYDFYIENPHYQGRRQPCPEL